MRELTKSLGSFGWAMSLFGLKRLAEVMMPRASTPGGPPTWDPSGRGGAEAFDRMTGAAREHLGDGGFHEMFRSGDQIFRSLVDMMLGGGCADCPPPGPGPGDPRVGAWSTPPQPHAPPPPHAGAPNSWGPMPSSAAPPGPPSPSPGGWGPMSPEPPPTPDRGEPSPGAAVDAKLDAAAGARGWGPMPPVPPPGAGPRS